MADDNNIIVFNEKVKNYSDLNGFPEEITTLYEAAVATPVSMTYLSNGVRPNILTVEPYDTLWGTQNDNICIGDLITWEKIPHTANAVFYMYRFPLGVDAHGRTAWIAWYCPKLILDTEPSSVDGYKYRFYPTLATNLNSDFTVNADYHQLYQSSTYVTIWKSTYGQSADRVALCGARFYYCNFVGSSSFQDFTQPGDNYLFTGNIMSGSYSAVLPENAPYPVIPGVTVDPTLNTKEINLNSYDWPVTSSVNYYTTSLVLQYVRDTMGYGQLQPELGDFSEEAGPVSGSGGYEGGTFDDASDTVDVPTVPTVGVSNVGFVRVYKTTLNSLTSLGNDLFPPLNYTPPSTISDNQSVSEAIVDGFNQIVTFLANVPSFFDQIVANTLINYIIDCHIIPVEPTAGSTEAIHVGHKTLETTASRVTTDYVDFDCGDISIREYYQNFADFLTTAKLYLPFIGFVPVRPEWFQSASLNVTYRFNIIDGSFIAYVRGTGSYVNNHNSGKTILGQYGGNACVHLPITGVTYASMVSGLVGAGAGMMAGAASGNPAMLATSAIAAAGLSGDIAQSNSYSATAAFLGCRRPFLMIERPVSSYARNYQHEVGIPSNIYAKLGDVSGFNQMTNVHVDKISRATDQEKEEIRKLLASGVIV